MADQLYEAEGVRVAIEGCGHGTLHAIYASVETSCKARNWEGVDLLIIGGDFQATRNAADLTVMAVPPKYRAMGDFHAYYSGERVAPYLTIFVGGNHEAAAYLWELYYGGWVAPRIYYMGAASVLRLGPLRIAGLSGIWKGFDYRKPHHERLPFGPDEVRSFYHVRQVDVQKLLQIREPTDIGISHDWPRAIEKHGDSAALFRQKPFFRNESIDGTLGSPAAAYVMDRLRPSYWFSAHLHCKYSAIKKYDATDDDKSLETKAPDATSPAQPKTHTPAAPAFKENPEEIDLGLDDSDVDDGQAENKDKPSGKSELSGTLEQPVIQVPGLGGISREVLAQLPASFMQPQRQRQEQQQHLAPGQPVPPTIKNTVVRFLALDKCLPGRRFLQLCEIPPASSAIVASRPPSNTSTVPGRYQLEYDPEWLAITRVFSKDLVIGDPSVSVPPDLGEEHYRPLIDAERAWVEENVVQKGLLKVPENFVLTAPVHTPIPGRPETFANGQPEEYTNPQTAAFCELVGVRNLWDASQQEREERKLLARSTSLDFGQEGRQGGYRGRGGGFGRGGRGGRGNRGRGWGGGHGRW